MLSSDVMHVVLRYLEDLDCPEALSQSIKLRNGDWAGVLAYSPDPRSYRSYDSYYRAACSSAILRKCKSLETEIDLRAAAVEKWHQGEKDCYHTNQRLTRYLPENQAFSDRDEGISEFLGDVRKQLFDWLGPVPPKDLLGRFGPGATATDRGWNVTVPHKMSSTPSFTHGSLAHLPSWAVTAWGRAIARTHGELQVIKGNRFTTVPKTALTDRSIASEPSVSVFFQLAIGSAIRGKLLRNAGWSLDHAQDLHRRVACGASETCEFATLDLSNASDTLAKELVKLLLPPRWYELLASVRSPMTCIDENSLPHVAKRTGKERWVLLEKFSSMGNGFTFELETIIFAAISCVTSRKLGHVGELGVDVYVYGDDIIVKDDVALPLSSVLAFCGFSLNREKSFWGGVPFRESCGGDYFRGRPVRPHYLKDTPREPQHWISLANGLKRTYDRLDPDRVHVRRRAWFDVLERLPSRIRSCRGPEALGDYCVHDERSRWNYKWEDGVRSFRVYKPHRHRVVRWKQFDPLVVLASAVYGVRNHGGIGVIPRDSVISYTLDWMAYS